jgi:hypothetical protein
MLVISRFIVLLSLFQPVANFSDEFVVLGQLLVHRHHAHHTWQVWKHGGGITPIHHPKWGRRKELWKAKL